MTFKNDQKPRNQLIITWFCQTLPNNKLVITQLNPTSETISNTDANTSGNTKKLTTNWCSFLYQQRINANLKVSVDKPSVLLIDWSTVPIKGTVSDINQNQTAMNVTPTYNNQSSEVLEFSFPQGNLKGSSVSENSTVTPSLPVILISFNGTTKANGALLNWKTTSETDLSHYVIQHSTNGLVFENLSLVVAKNSAGVFNYNFTDNNARFGVNYYRLLSVDIDGKTSLCEPIAIN